MLYWLHVLLNTRANNRYCRNYIGADIACYVRAKANVHVHIVWATYTNPRIDRVIDTRTTYIFSFSAHRFFVVVVVFPGEKINCLVVSFVCTIWLHFNTILTCGTGRPIWIAIFKFYVLVWNANNKFQQTNIILEIWHQPILRIFVHRIKISRRQRKLMPISVRVRFQLSLECCANKLVRTRIRQGEWILFNVYFNSRYCLCSLGKWKKPWRVIRERMFALTFIVNKN